MIVAARLERPNARDRRSAQRRKLFLGSQSIRGADHVVIHDISTTGMLLATSAPLHSSEEIELELPEAGPVKATVVWTSGKYFGCQFRQPIPKSAVSAALLRSPAPPTREELQVAGDPHDEEDGSDELTFGTKLRVILGTSLGLWALIFLGVSLVRHSM